MDISATGNAPSMKPLRRMLIRLSIAFLCIALAIAAFCTYVINYFAVYPHHRQHAIRSRGLDVRPSPLPLLRQPAIAAAHAEALLKDLDLGDLMVHFPTRTAENTGWNNYSNVPHATMYFGDWKGAARAVHLSDNGLTMARMTKIAATHRLLFVRKLRCPGALRDALRTVCVTTVEQELARPLKDKELKPSFRYRGIRLAMGLADTPHAGFMCSSSILFLLEKAGILVPAASGPGIQLDDATSHFWTPWQLLDIDGARPLKLRWSPGCSWDVPFVWDDATPLSAETLQFPS